MTSIFDSIWDEPEGEEAPADALAAPAAATQAGSQVAGPSIEEPQKPNIFDNVWQQDDDDAAVVGNLEAAAGTTPAAWAELLKLGEKVGLPADIVKSDPRAVRAIDLRRQANDILNGSPALKKAFANKDFAALGQNDRDKFKTVVQLYSVARVRGRQEFRGLSYLDRNWINPARTKFNQLLSGQNLNDADLAAARAYGMNKIDAAGGDRAAEMRVVYGVPEGHEWGAFKQAADPILKRYANLRDDEARKGMRKFNLAGMETDISEHLAAQNAIESMPKDTQFDEVLAQNDPGQTLVALLDKPGRLWRLVFEGLVTSAPGLVAGLATGPAGGMMASMYTEQTMAMLEGLQHRGINVKDKDALLAAFSDRDLMDDVRAESIRKGAGVAAIDVFGMLAAGKVFAPKALFGRELGATARQGINLLPQTLIQSATEGLGEAFGQLLARGEIDWNEAMLEAIAGGGMAIGDVAAFGGRRALGNMRRERIKKRIFREERERTDKLREVIESIAVATGETEMATHSPESLRGLVEDIQQEAGIDTVFVDPAGIEEYLQSANLDRGEAFDLMGITEEQFDDAQDTGGYVEVSLADWVLNEGMEQHREGLAAHTKFSRDHHTESEIKLMEEESVDPLEAFKAGQQDDREFFDEEASAWQVYHDINRQLVAQGTSPGEAALYAGMWRAALRNLAKRRGVSAFDLYKTVQPEIKRRAAAEEFRQRTESNIDLILNRIREGKKGVGLSATPALDIIRNAGVRPGSTLAGELKNLGINTKPFERPDGLGDLDNFVGSEHPLFEGIDDSVVPEGEPGGGLVRPAAFYEALGAEQRGEPVRSLEEAAAEEEFFGPMSQLSEIMEELGLDVADLTNEEIKAAITEAYDARVDVEEYSQLPKVKDLTKEQKAALNRYLRGRPDAKEIREQFRRHKGTGWHDQAVWGAITRQHLEDLIAGREVNYESALSNPRYQGPTKAAAQGAEGIWEYLTTNRMLGDAAKPVNSVNSTFLNCRPSKGCAGFCYATGGNYRYDGTVFKAEMVNWAIETDPVRAAKLTARQYKATAEYHLKKALRLMDKGDLGPEWIAYIEELNRQGVRVQVFSKRPELLRQVSDYNLRLLSVDDKNSKEMAENNPDLPLAVVYSGTKDIPFLEKYADRVQVILPIKIGRTVMDQSEITPIPKELKRHLCPVDGFGKQVGKTADGKWNCTRCDKNGGVGCFHGSGTSAMLEQIEKDIRNEPDELAERLGELEAEARKLSGGRRDLLLRRIDFLVSAVRRGVDLEKEDYALERDQQARQGDRVDDDELFQPGRPDQPAGAPFKEYFQTSGLFYSQVARNVQSRKDDKGSGAQWRKHLAQGAGAEREMEWIVGLEEFLQQDGSIHRDDVAAFVEQNGIRLDEVVLGDRLAYHVVDAGGEVVAGPYESRELAEAQQHMMAAEVGDNAMFGEEFDVEAATGVDELTGEPAEINSALFTQWTVAGGKKQREFYLTLPRADGPANALVGDWLVPQGHRTYDEEADNRLVVRIRVNDRDANTYTADDISKIEALISDSMGRDQNREVKPKYLSSGAPDYGVRKGLITELQAAQWRHARNWYGDQDGAVTRTLFIEEVQGERQQAAREEGYKPATTAEKEYFTLAEEVRQNLLNDIRIKIGKGSWSYAPDFSVDVLDEETRDYKPWQILDWARNAASADDAARLEAKSEEVKQHQSASGVPAIPFGVANEWGALALKRMIALAVEEGYESVAWTPGEIQADRYSLHETVDFIDVKRVDGVEAEAASTDLPKEELRKVNINAGPQTIELLVDNKGRLFTGSSDFDPTKFHGDPARTTDLEGKTLADVVGKEMADKILDVAYSEPKEWTAKNAARLEELASKRIAENKDFYASPLDGLTDSEKSEYLELLSQRWGDANDSIAVLRGVDLKIGGEGMKAFYDRMVVNMANKLGKKYGVKVGVQALPLKNLPSTRGTVTMSFEEWLGHAHSLDLVDIVGDDLEPYYTSKYEEYVDEMSISKLSKLGQVDVWSLPITDAMRAGVKEHGLSVFQEGDELQPRGSFQISQDRSKRIINLFQNADRSTFLHESGHAFLEMMRDLDDAAAPAQFRQDVRTLHKWFGISSWGQVTTEHHEKFAAGFETYLMEGQAPSPELRDLFSQFKDWLTDIYKSLTTGKASPPGTISPEVKAVFDRLLASDEEIAASKELNEFMPLIGSAELAEDLGMTDSEYARYVRRLKQQEETAKEKMMVDLAKDIAGQRKAKLAEIKEKVQGEVTEEFTSLPLWRVLAYLRRGEFLLAEDQTEDTSTAKLNRSQVVEMFGEGILTTLPGGKGKTGLTSNDATALHPEIVASFFGFKSAEQMIQEILDSAVVVDGKDGRPRSKYLTMAQAIKREVARRIEAEDAAKLTDERLREAAVDAYHNMDRGELLSMELAILRRHAGDQADLLRRGAERRLAEEGAGTVQGRTGEIEDAAEGVAQADEDTDQQGVRQARARQAGAEARAGAARPLRAAERVARGRAMRAVRVSTTEAREAARGFVAKMTVGDLGKLAKYAQDERRAGRKADKALRDQEWMQAAEFKWQQMLNHFIFMEGQKALKERTKAFNLFKRFNVTNKNTKSIDTEYLLKIQSILAAYGVGPARLDPATARVGLADIETWVNFQNTERENAESAQIVVDPSVFVGARDVNEISIEELETLRKAIMSLSHNGNQRSKEAREAEKEYFLEIADSIYANNRLRPDMPEYDDKKTRAKDMFFGFAGILRKIESLTRELDGLKDGGPVWTAVFKPIADAQAAAVVKRREAMLRVQELLTAHGKKGKWWTQHHHVPGGAVMSKTEILGIALNMGNEGNRAALTNGGRGFLQTDEMLNEYLSKLDDSDWDWVQSVWDHVNEYWGEIAALEERMTGVAPEKIPADEFTTPGGRVMRGGYFPIKFDPRRSPKSHQEALTDAAKDLSAGTAVRAATKHGHTIARTGNKDKPIYLSVDVYFQHLDQVIHDLTHREAVRQVARLINDKNIREALYHTKGLEQIRYLDGWLKNVARGAQDPMNTLEKIVKHVRLGVSIAEMGFSFRTALVQPLGLTQSIVALGETALLRGVKDFYASPNDMARFIMEKSPMMTERASTFDRDIGDQLKKMKPGGGMDRFRSGAFWMIGFLDLSVSMPTWLAAYQVKLGEPGSSESDAIGYADSIVRRSQGSGNAPDLAPVQSGGEYQKMFTAFYTFFSAYHNMMVDAYKVYRKRPPTIGSTMKVAKDMLWLSVIPALLTAYILDGAFGEDEDDDDKPWPEEALEILAGFAVGGIPLVRDIMKGLTTDFGVGGPTLVKVGESVAGAVELGLKGAAMPFDEDVEITRGDMRSALMAAGYLFHMPSRQAWRTADYFNQYLDGEFDEFEPFRAFVTGAPYRR